MKHFYIYLWVCMICCSVSAQTFNGNGSTGLDGTLGNGSITISDGGATVDFTFSKGSGSGVFNKYIVLYLDSKPGGITSTANLTDASIPRTRAISRFNGSLRSTLNFPTGFEPDYAIVIIFNDAAVYELVENSSLPFVADPGLNPFNDQFAASHNFSVNDMDINLSNLSDLKFVASAVGFFTDISNEFIGRTIYDGDALPNPGFTTVDMQTYFQASTGFQGGEAPSQADGNWSNNATWLNGNPPFVSDKITISNNVTLDTNVTLDNTIEITSSNTLALDTGFEITGTGTITVGDGGALQLNDGSSTSISPTYATNGILRYFGTSVSGPGNEWLPNTTVGQPGGPSSVSIGARDFYLSNPPAADNADEDFLCDLLTIPSGGDLIIEPTKSLTVNGNLTNAGNLTMQSDSQNYASLLIDSGISFGGTNTYSRHVNTIASGGSTTGSNDLISPPVTNASQTFGAFRTANSNLPSGTIGGSPAFLFGHFDNSIPEYVNYTTANDSDVLTAGVGYRTASTDNAPFTFQGDILFSNVNVPITIGAGSPWNLIGNPYTAYINAGDFLTQNASLLDENASGIYGYDGAATDGFTIINFNNANTATNLAPGQGFFVSAEAAGNITFTPAMRRSSGGDDFIAGRAANATNHYLKLEMTATDKRFVTEFYFNNNSSLGLDPGYDAINFNNEAPAFSIYSHLVENNEGDIIAMQSLNIDALSNVVVPLGIHASQGEQFTISIDESTLPSTTNVYLDDTQNSTSFLLNDGDFILTPSTTLNGTGRFFLRFSEDALSIPENNVDALNIFTRNQTKEIVIEGQLNAESVASLYDLNGRLITDNTLSTGNISHSIGTDGLSSGVYVVVISNNNFRTTKKVILK
ncbi:T9SS type A sorting domain-containing protein [Winogradskyella sp. 3972H.M.0a.05]|uniref:T9SS type A sorting domain-containing protein n=1 Tax=Winogradskyella sp. 3972H.M.0a.05 TaxID=2950277 RepID=UPI003395391C